MPETDPEPTWSIPLSAASPAAPTRRDRPVTTDGPRTNPKAIGGSASIPVLSATWGAYLLMLAAMGTG